MKIKAAQDVDRAEMILADSQSELFNEVSCELDKEADGASVERIDLLDPGDLPNVASSMAEDSYF